jgi:hypothetical protein
MPTIAAGAGSRRDGGRALAPDSNWHHLDGNPEGPAGMA